MLVPLLVVVVVALVVGGLAVVLYNRLVRKRNTCEEAWASIDVQLTRRADLVPNLVRTVQGYAGHEKTVLEEVTAARAAVAGASGPREAGEADTRLEGALRQLFAVAEAYPELKANENFLQLQTELSGLEEEIAFSRRYYNATVRDYDIARETFPTLLVAGPFGFSELEYFKSEAGDRAVPEVDFR